VVWSGLRGGLSFPLHQVRSLLPVYKTVYKRARDRGRGPDTPRISFLGVNVHTTDATTGATALCPCFQHVLHVKWL